MKKNTNNNKYTFSTVQVAKDYLKAIKSISVGGWGYKRKGKTITRNRTDLGKLLDLKYKSKRNGKR